MGVAFHLGGVHLPAQVLGAALFGKEGRTAEELGGHTGDADAGGLHGENLGHAAAAEQPVKLPPHFLVEFGVHLVVQEAIHRQDVPIPHHPVPQDALLHQKHKIPSLYKV